MRRRLTPDWLIQIAWFIAGVFATGAIWYFLSQNNYHFALWSGFGATVCALLAVTLLIRNDLVRREQATTHKRSEDETIRVETQPGNVPPGPDDARGDRSQEGKDHHEGAKISVERETTGWPPIRVRLADGTVLDVELSLQFRVKPEDAPTVVQLIGPIENVKPFLRPLVDAAVLSELSRLKYPQLAASLPNISANLTHTVATRAQPSGITILGVYITKLTER